MSAEDVNDGEKEHAASPQRLERARQDGDIPRSIELQASLAIGGLLIALAVTGGWVMKTVGSAGMIMLEQSDRLSTLAVSGGVGALGGIVLAFALPPIALVLLGPALILVMLAATRGIVFAPKKLAFKLSRISPVATAKQKFGPEGLFEFGKSALKLGAVAAILYLFLAARFEDILANLYLTPAMSAAFLGRLTMEFIFIIFLITLAFGGIDYLWQLHRHGQRLRMSRKEVIDEYKESEGDPQLKSTRRQRAQEIATNRMLADVAKADVIVVNPTHYAVALRWDRSKGSAPVCVAKGVDEIARKIRELALEHGVPIHSDPPTARSIHASVEIGQEIRLDQYRAVAAAVRFADAMRKRARRR